MKNHRRRTRKAAVTAAAVLLLSQPAAAQNTLAEFCEALYIIAGLLASVMLVLQGLKWVMSDAPQERLDAKKGIMYVLIGLLVVYMAAIFVSLLYCQTIQGYDENCPGADCSINCSLGAIGGCNIQGATGPSNPNPVCANACGAGGGQCTIDASACSGIGGASGTDANANTQCQDYLGASATCCCMPAP